MSLKILIFPLLVILSLTVVIGYIKPDITDILAKRDELAQKKIDLEKVDAVIDNIRRLHADIDQQRETENFVLRYLPLSLEEERVLDTFNFLANQSGVVIQQVDISENQPVEEAGAVSEHASVSFEAFPSGTVPDPNAPPALPARIVESYKATVKVLGSYAGLKDFFARLDRTDRMHEIAAYAVETRDKNETAAKENEVTYPADFLRGIYEADFVYFKPARVNSALTMPLFQSPNFDFSVVDALFNLVNSPLPPLEVGETGKTNPFL